MSTRLFNIFKLSISHIGKDAEQLRTFTQCWWKSKMVQYFMKRSIHLPYLSQNVTKLSPRENNWPHKDFYINVDSSFICNSWKLEATQKYKEIDKLCCIIFNGIVLNNKNKWADEFIDMDESQNHYSKLMKPDTNKYILFHLICLKFYSRKI